MTSELLQDADACYQALRTRDARFDGRFFVGVTSTRIYCRPVCRVRPPRQDHCRFFGLAAQAEQAGYRPCLRCRPELAPSDRHWSFHDAGDRLIGHALRWLDDPANGLADTEGRSALVRLSDFLGITDRHLRRLFSLHLVSALDCASMASACSSSSSEMARKLAASRVRRYVESAIL